jgi:tungstate transport system ATP-binding protein
VTEPIYAIQDLQHGYDGRPVLQIPHLTLAPHGIVGLVGPNGSGKSTLLRLLAAVETPLQGRIDFEGVPLAPFAPAVRFRITLLSQEPYLLRRSVQRNVAYGLALRGGSPALKDRVAEALTLVGLQPERFAPRSWRALSGGEAQRVALAARLILRPTVLLLDEPTASVDAFSAQLIQDAALRARQEWGTTLVIASHDRPWLHEVCDRVLHLFQGRVMDADSGAIVFGPWTPRTDGLWEKPLGDGQTLKVPPPPDPEAAALIPAVVLTPDPGGALPPGHMRLDSLVTRVAIDKGSARILATCQMGSLALTVPLDPQKAEQIALLPGRRLDLTYPLEAVRWM